MDTSLLAGLTEAQAAAVTSEAAPLCILAGAGSGKTRVLTRRIAWRVGSRTADAPHVLALTFTRRAAGEMQGRLASLGVRPAVVAGTFHAVAYAALRRQWADRGHTPPTILDRKVGLLRRLLGPTGGSRAEGAAPGEVAAEIEWAKARLIEPSAYEREALRSRRRPPLPVGAMAGLYERYEHEKHKRGLVDFDDLLRSCADEMAEDVAFAARHRWRFRHLFVDEYQDVNPLQARLLDAWRGDRLDLCVVGDPNQAIYGWNGSDPELIGRFAETFPSAQVIALDENFRSTPQLVATAAAVLPGRAPPLRAHRGEGPPPTVRSYADEAAEARGIARSLRDRHRPGAPWRHQAVLTRTHAQVAILEKELAAAQIPYRIRGGRPFLDHPEVRAILDELATWRGPLAAALTDLDALGIGVGVGVGVGVGARSELARLGRELAALDPTATVDSFGAWLKASFRSAEDAPDRRSDAAEVTTFHAAKGLEWPIVFVAGLERGLVPVGHASTDQAVEEERRLLYVALTRASDELHCSWARSRSYGGRPLPRSPSPWLADIEAAVEALTERPDASADQWQRRLAEARGRVRRRPAAGGRQTVVAGADADPQVLAALRAWRSDAARAAGVPAHIIFHDTTLAVVAEARPDSRDSLLALPGLGPVKAERYGDDLLRLVAEHLAS